MLGFVHLHHEDDGVEGDEGEDEVFERVRHNHTPDAVPHRVLVLRHVPTQRLRINRKVDALFLNTKNHSLIKW